MCNSSGGLNSRAALQVLLDLGRVLSVVAFDLLVERAIALVDVVDVRVDVERASPRELASLGVLLAEIFDHAVHSCLARLVRTVNHRARRCVILVTSRIDEYASGKCEHLIDMCVCLDVQFFLLLAARFHVGLDLCSQFGVRTISTLFIIYKSTCVCVCLSEPSLCERGLQMS